MKYYQTRKYWTGFIVRLLELDVEMKNAQCIPFGRKPVTDTMWRAV